MIKLIISDLDGTLLNHDKIVAYSDLLALHNAKVNGVELCLASGRIHSDIQKVMKKIGYLSHSISQNGAFVHTKEGTILHSSLLHPSLVHHIYEAAEQFCLVKVASSAEKNFIDYRDAASEHIHGRMLSDMIIRPNLQKEISLELGICKFSIFGDMGKLLDLKRRLENDWIKDQISLFITDRDCLDIVPFGVSKGKGVRILCEAIGLKPEEIACIGDYFNDISMLKYTTPNSFAMKGSHREVMKAAKHSVANVAEAVDWVLNYNRTN